MHIYQEVAPFVYKSKANLWNTVPVELKVTATTVLFIWIYRLLRYH